jgi:hypothetical protein
MSELKVFGYIPKSGFKSMTNKFAVSLLGVGEEETASARDDPRTRMLTQLIDVVNKNSGKAQNLESYLKVFRDALTECLSSKDAGHEVETPAQANAKQVKRLSQKGTIWHAVSNFASPDGKESWEKVKTAIKLIKGEGKNICEVDNLVPWMTGDDRGVFGETPLHILLLFNNFNEPDPNLFQFFSELWDLCPLLHALPYTRPLYEGENVLHIAIIKKAGPDVFAKMKSSPNWTELCEGRATGEFFKKEQLSEGSCHLLGEYPLGFAACTNQPTVFKDLVESVASGTRARLLKQTTSEENNLLHLMVLNAFNRKNLDDEDSDKDPDQTAEKAYMSMYETIAKCMEQYEVLKELTSMPNEDGHTPLTLAAASGSLAFFNFLISKEVNIAWIYGPVTCRKLRLRGIDIDLRKEREENRARKQLALANPTPDTQRKNPAAARWQTAIRRVQTNLRKRRVGADLSILEILVRHGRKDIVAKSLIDKLVDIKWEKYGRRWFYLKLGRSLLFTGIIVLITIVHQHRDSSLSNLLHVGARVLATALYGFDFFQAIKVARAVE